MAAPVDVDALSKTGLKAMVTQLLAEVAELKRIVAGQRDAIARLKKLKGRPRIKPSGMEKANRPKGPGAKGSRRRGGKKTSTETVDEERAVKVAAVPEGSRFKGYESFIVQDLVLRPHVTRYLRQRWLTPDGRTLIAPLPESVNGHFGPEPRRFVLLQYHQGQVSVPRLVAQLRAMGVEISKRQSLPPRRRG